MATSSPVSSTQSVHAGEARFRSHNSLTVPLVQSSVYTFESCEALLEFTEERMFWDEPQREEYGRYGNPTVRAAEAKLAALEGGEEAILVSSGMGAVTSLLLLMLRAGDHLILTDECYLSTLHFCHDFLPRWGIETTTVRHGDYTALEAAIRPTTRLIFSESPTNPFNHCLDLARLVEIAARHNIRTAIDSTFATPANLRPLDHGVDLVVHSVTKYLGGHNDLLAGVVIGKASLMTPLRQMQGLLGNIVSPQTAWLILRGVKTLALRMARHNANGLAVARFLEAHSKVRRVWYPGLKSHRDHALARHTMAGFGGVVSFEVEGDAEAAYRFINALSIATIGPSLGGVETLVSPLALMGYANVTPEEREALGIRDELVRLCCGIEETDDLLADLEQALDAL
jgi:cystathionine gamma-synthase